MNHIPQVMKDQKNWLLWRRKRVRKPYGYTYTKQPVGRDGRPISVQEKKNLLRYAHAMLLTRRPHFSGVGFALIDDWFAIDLDHCITQNCLHTWAAQVVQDVASYTEVSPSGHGLHIICKAPVEFGRKVVWPQKGTELRIIDRGYVTVTGRSGGKNPVNQNADHLKKWYAATFPQEEKGASAVADTSAKQTINDNAILSRLQKNYKEFFDHNWTHFYPSASEADLAFCRYVRVYGGTPEQAGRLLRRSSLMRDKLNRPDYIPRTVKLVFATKLKPIGAQND